MIENFSLNYTVFYFFNNFAGYNIYYDNFFIFLSKYLIFILIAIFFFYFSKLIWKDKKVEMKEVFIYTAGSIFAWLLTRVIKFFYSVERPFAYLENVNLLIKRSDIYDSFPSGHSTLAFALATSLFLYNKKIGLLALSSAILISLGRIFTGVHFPLDILVGAFIGVSIPYLIFILSKENNDK